MPTGTDETTTVRESLFDPEQHFLQHLRQGFASLNRQQQLEEEEKTKSQEDIEAKESTNDNGDNNNNGDDKQDEDSQLSEVHDDDDDKETFLSHIPVNVIDPSSAAVVLVPAKESSDKKLDLFPQIQNCLQSDFHSTLRDLPYQHFRSGAKGVMRRLHVRLEQTPLVTLAPGNIQDPANVKEWHLHYGAHVYLAACHSLEHYRTQVKPAIQVFVSQLEALVQERNSKSKPSYLIVFCPTSTKQQQQQQQQATDNSSTTTSNATAATSTTTAASEPTEAPRSRVASFASRMVAARQRMTAVTSSSTASGIGGGGVDTSTTNTDTSETADDTTTTTNNNFESSSSSSPSTGLTKIDRDILRRLTTDFPQARVCTLPSVARKTQQQDDETTTTTTTDPIEWEALWIELGATLVDGFAERCRLYDDQLKKLATTRAAKQLNPAKAAYADRELLLAKESFAFLYQLYHQPAEALMQYEELRALLPDEKIQKKTADDTILKQALDSSNDPTKFGQCIRQADDLASIAYELEHYLLVRETSQVLALGQPAEVVKRCKAFVWMLFQMKLTSRAAASPEGLRKLNTWAFEFCWDVQTACLELQKPTPELARALCDLLTFARLCLLKLAKALLPDYNGTHLGDAALPPELTVEWEPWVPQEDVDNNDNAAAQQPQTAVNTEELPTHNLVKASFENIEGFERLYMQVTKTLATHHETCHRQRHAACLRHEVIEIAARRNNLRSAAQELGDIARVYEQDGWDACNFFLLFRLAKLQRQFETAQHYLQTLVRCFTSPCAPPKALDTLFRDLQAVVRFLSSSPSDNRNSLAAAPIFQPILSLEKFEMTKVSGTDRNLLKKVYSIGETVSVKFTVTSHLPQEIPLEELSVSLVPFQTYVTAMEDSLEIKEWDWFQVLSLKGLTLAPGSNEYVYEWIPQTSGQFILSSVIMNWEKSLFTYTAVEMKRPTIRIDVIPCEPTQSITIKPDYIVPGHQQAMDVIFHSKVDFVDSGTIQLVGSPGLVICEAAKEGQESSTWQSLLEMDLPQCGPGESVKLPILVKSTMDKDIGAVATLHAHASTMFRRENEPSKNTGDREQEGAELECILDKKISTLGKRAFSLSIPEMVAYKADKLLINASIRCNAPKSFLLQKWSVDLPSFLKLAEDGDLNDSLANTHISSRELLSFTFDCVVVDEVPLSSQGALVLTFDNEQGTTFTDSYKLRLKRPEQQPIPQAETESLTVTVTPSTTQGMVGRPIDLSCSIETSARLVDQEIHYTVSSHVHDWVLNGKTKGTIRGSSLHTLDFVAIPTRPGSMKEYLTLSFTTVEEGGRKLELPVKLDQQGPFASVDPPNHPTVAFPVLV